MLKHSFCIVILVILAVCAPPPPLSAAPLSAPIPTQEPKAHLSQAEAESFSDALDTLATQGHIAIVAEGVPLVPHPAKKDIPDLTVAVPLSQAVAEIAAAYDYDVQKPNRVFILTKRYTSPKELPSVTLEECQLAFRDVLTLLNKFSPQFDEASDNNSQRGAVRAFFGSLSPAQLQAVQVKTLHYAELTPEQQGIVRRIFLYGFVQSPADTVSSSENLLRFAPHSVLTGRDGNYTGLLIQNTIPSNNSRYYRPLWGDAKFTSLSEPRPPLLLPLPGAVSQPAEPEPKTLKKIVGLLPHTGLPPVVDTALQDKPVSVAGLNSVSSSEVLSALAVLYDLHVGVTEAGAPELMRRSFTTNISLQDLPQSVWAIVPAPLRRAVHQEEALPAQDQPGAATAPVFEFEQRMQRQELLSTLRNEAEHQVVVGLQPQFRNQGLGAHIPVKTLNEATQRALAVALSGGALQELLSSFTGKIKQNVIDCLDDMNDILVYTVPSETAVVHGQAVPSLYFEGTNPYTHQKIGLGGVMFGNTP